MDNRNQLIDVAKGISIILVSLHHSQLAHKYFWHLSLSLGLFRIPLFFFLSGIFFSASAKPTEFFFKKTDALLKPYFVTLFFLLFASILSNESNIGKQAVGILYGNGHTIRWVPLWFLTNLWSTYVISYLLFHYTKLDNQKIIIKVLLIFSLLFIGVYLIDKFWLFPVFIFGLEIQLPGLPFNFDLVILSMAFFVAGYFLNRRVKEFNPNITIFMAALLIFVFIATNTEAAISFHRRLYNEPIYATLAAISGIYITLSISHAICKKQYLRHTFTAFGSASLFVLIFHSSIGAKIYYLLNSLFHVNSILFVSILAFLASITIPLLIRKAMLKNDFLMFFYFPLKTNKLFHTIRNQINSRSM